MKLLRNLTAAILMTVGMASGADAATAGEKTLTVQRGDSLYTIVRLQYPDSAESWAAISRDILALNPEAFRNGDPASLRVGAELRLPDYSTPVAARPPMRVPPEAADAPVTATPDEPRLPLAVIGEVIELSGAPAAIDINNRQRALAVTGKVYRGDALLSDGGGTARIIMNDGAELLLRPSSRVVIDDYTFIESDAPASRSLIRLLKGGMRFITGLIGRRNPDGFHVQTSVATIGVRGTDFAALLCGANDCLLPGSGPLQEGAYSGVLDGAIAIANDAGEFPVARGEVMRTVARDAAPEPAPEAARLLFTADELAMLEPAKPEPMNFFQWIRAWIKGTL